MLLHASLLYDENATEQKAEKAKEKVMWLLVFHSFLKSSLPDTAKLTCFWENAMNFEAVEQLKQGFYAL